MTDYYNEQQTKWPIDEKKLPMKWPGDEILSMKLPVD